MEFISETMSDVCKLLQINKINSNACHHQSIGAIENTHNHLGAFLRRYLLSVTATQKHGVIV